MKQREIWFASFPVGSGHEYRKERPVLIIQGNKALQKTNVITIIPFSSNTSNCIQDDILVVRNNHNNLYRDSVLKVHHIYSFDKNRFIKKIGKVKKEVIENAKEYLKEHFELTV